MATVPQLPIEPSADVAGLCLTAPALHLDRSSNISPEEAITLGKICTKPVVTASAQMMVDPGSTRDAIQERGRPVVVNAGRPVGMLTDRDITVAVGPRIAP